MTASRLGSTMAAAEQMKGSEAEQDHGRCDQSRQFERFARSANQYSSDAVLHVQIRYWAVGVSSPVHGSSYAQCGQSWCGCR